MNINIEVNQKVLSAEKDETILDVLERNGIKVPTLCHMKDFLPTGACRMCVVEDMGSGKMIPACSSPVQQGMKLMTHSHRVVEARKTIVELLLSNHPDDCLYCVRNGKCDLQHLALEHNILERRIKGEKSKKKKDLSSPGIERDPDKCILCGRCIQVCDEVMGVSAIDFLYRGSKSVVGTTFNKGLNLSNCVNCGQCIMVCPTGALTEKSHFPEIRAALSDPGKTVVVQYAPAVSVSIAEEFGIAAGTDIAGILNASLRKMGFDLVFDTSFAADLTIMEESAELLKRVESGENLPLITSCCPAWIKYAEQFAPDFLNNLSTCKSPQQMLGAIIKHYLAPKLNITGKDIYSVAIMPCTAKKFEGQREEMTQHGITDVDAILTTRELVQLIRMHGIDIPMVAPELADSPFGIRSSAGKLFGASGGVMEAAIRTSHYLLTGKEMQSFRLNEIRGNSTRKEMSAEIGGIKLGFAVVNGLAQAGKLLDEIRNGRNDLHFIEVMACPNGCIGGGGQPLNSNPEALICRMKSLYAIDNTEGIKVSHKNPEVTELYRELLQHPLSHVSHELLHTTYKVREV